ncbi:hypothetical protein [Mycetocola sp. 2940]|uniref:TY-Chap2 family putative peptide chaperone n=1 Tax=Mycetocola sp. 2940 TaxID=3156452 RepID=UPI00339764E4
MTLEDFTKGPLRRYAIHFEWIPGHAQNGPVGIWNEFGEYHYPESTVALQEKGAQSFADRGTAHTYTTWLAMREETTSIYGANWSSIDSRAPMDAVIETLVADFLSVEHPTMTFEADGLEVPIAEEIEMTAPAMAPAERHIIAESWWIISELAARHPEYLAWEMHPGGGMYDCLALLKPGESPVVQLNRAGSLHVSTKSDFRLSWESVFANPSPHGPVKAIEEAAGLPLNGPRPASTHRTLAYRLIAKLLSMQLHDRHYWDARNEFLDSSDWDAEELRGYLDYFPMAAVAARSASRLGLHSEPQSHFWAILRDDTPIAVVSIEGVLYRKGRAFDLMDEYQAAGKSITGVVAKCFGDCLR